MRVSTLPTPVGPFTIVEQDGAVLASGWTSDVDDLLPLVARALRDGDPVRVPGLGPVGEAVEAYLAGDLAAIEAVPVRQSAGPFLEHAWEVLRAVPAGAPVTYAEFARRCERPAAVRAAASACARNAAALFVPCHRVLRSGGSLGGYRWGTPVKQWLLSHEAAVRREEPDGGHGVLHSGTRAGLATTVAKVGTHN